MSRIGKKIINIPDGVEVTINDTKISVKGPKGELSQDISRAVKFEEDKDAKTLSCFLRDSEDKRSAAKWGLYRVLVNNMVVGVSEGFSKTLIVDGVGYRAELKGSDLLISAGFSHPFIYRPAEGITFSVEGTNKVTVSGIDKQRVGQVAAEIRAIRPPEPFKGKGIRYDGEYIIRKAGKAGA